MKRLCILTLAISMVAASISAAERQFSPRLGEGMPSSRSKTNYDEMAAVYGRRPNKRVPVERPSMMLSPEYMQKKEAAQARRARRSAQLRADREVALANRNAALAERRRSNTMAEERAPRIEALSRAYEGYEAPMPNLRDERLAAYADLELNPSALPNRFSDAELDQGKDLSQFTGYERTPRVMNVLENQSRMLPEVRDPNDPRGWSDPSLNRYNPNIRELIEAEGGSYREGQRTYPEYFGQQWNRVYKQLPSRETLGSYVPTVEGTKNAGRAFWNRASANKQRAAEDTAQFFENEQNKMKAENTGYRISVPSWETIKGVPSAMWSKVPSFRTTSTAGEILRENTVQAAGPNAGVRSWATGKLSDAWEGTKNAGQSFWNRMSENKRRALEETSKLPVQEDTGYRIPVERGLQYIPGTPAYKRAQQEALRNQALRDEVESLEQLR